MGESAVQARSAADGARCKPAQRPCPALPRGPAWRARLHRQAPAQRLRLALGRQLKRDVHRPLVRVHCGGGGGGSRAGTQAARGAEAGAGGGRLSAGSRRGPRGRAPKTGPRPAARGGLTRHHGGVPTPGAAPPATTSPSTASAATPPPPPRWPLTRHHGGVGVAAVEDHALVRRLAPQADQHLGAGPEYGGDLAGGRRGGQGARRVCACTDVGERRLQAPGPEAAATGGGWVGGWDAGARWDRVAGWRAPPNQQRTRLPSHARHLRSRVGQAAAAQPASRRPPPAAAPRPPAPPRTPCPPRAWG